jgi:hypothetical protein
MPTPPMSDQDMRDALALQAQHGTIAAAAHATGIPRTTLQHRHARAMDAVRSGRIASPPIPEIGQPPAGFEVVANNAQYDGDGVLKSQSVRTKRSAGAEYAVPDGHTIKGESALLDADGRLVARWVKTREGGASGLVDALKEAFAGYDGKAAPIEAPIDQNSDLLTIYPVPDLHFGMYSWKSETGSDYDTGIAAQVAASGIRTLVAQSQPSEHAVVLVLGDYFHQNDQKNATPGSGHRLDVDGRWAAVYHKGALLLLEIVKLVAAKHSRVTLKILPGNHDEDAAVTLTVAMSLFFSQEKRITVDMNPQNAWYHRFGKVLIGAHHGHQIRKFEQMAMAMAVDRAEDWGQTSFRYYYSGHIHHKKGEEIMGVWVQSFRSPAAPDAYNSGSGYRSNRDLIAITMHRNRGQVGEHTVAILSDNKIAA